MLGFKGGFLPIKTTFCYHMLVQFTTKNNINSADKVSFKIWTKHLCSKKSTSTHIYIYLITPFIHLFCSFGAYEQNFVSDIISTSEVAKGKLHSNLRLEVSQLSKPRVSDFGTTDTTWMLCDSLHAWWLTQSRLTALQTSLIARRWVVPQT